MSRAVWGSTSLRERMLGIPVVTEGCVLWEVREDFLEEGTPQVGFGKIEWEWK